MEDELIITVIATGFDSQYFHDQAAALAEAPVSSLNTTPPATVTPTENEPNEQEVNEAVSSINMSLDTQSAANFTEDDDTPTNIWQNATDD